MTNLQERKLQLENLIASLQEELNLVNEQLTAVVVTEEVAKEAIELNTRKAVILELGFLEATEEVLKSIESASDKVKEWVGSNSYFGAYVKGDEIIFNTERGASYKYLVDGVKKVTGKTLVSATELARQDDLLWNVWKNLNQYTDGGEI